MSHQYDRSEVPQFNDRPEDGRPQLTCIACQGPHPFDHDTGLCRPCWRIVILGPAMENQE